MCSVTLSFCFSADNRVLPHFARCSISEGVAVVFRLYLELFDKLYIFKLYFYLENSIVLPEMLQTGGSGVQLDPLHVRLELPDIV